MSEGYQPTDRHIVCDIETDDASDGAHNSLLTTNFSTYKGYGQIEPDRGGGTFLSHDLRGRGAQILPQTSFFGVVQDSGVSLEGACDSNTSDRGYDTYMSGAFKQQVHGHSGSNNCESIGLDITNLKIDSLTEDIAASPIQLREVSHETRTDSRADSLCDRLNQARINSELDSGFNKNCSLACSSGYWSGATTSAYNSGLGPSEFIHSSGSLASGPKGCSLHSVDSAYHSHHSHRSLRSSIGPSARPTVIPEHEPPHTVQRQLAEAKQAESSAKLSRLSSEELFAQNEDLDT